MPGSAGGYLPPVVAQLVADPGKFIATLQMAKAALLDFSKTEATARLGVTTDRFQATLTTARMELLNFARSVAQAKLGADAKPFWADIAQLRTDLAAMSPFDIRIDASVAGAMAKIEALQGALALAETGVLLGGGVGMGAGGGAGRGRGGGGGMTAALMAALWGKSMWGPFAGIGTVAGFAGFGLEHALMTLLGLGGSAAGGLLGGGALALGGLGTMGVGMGSDLAVMKSTLADTKTLVQAYTALDKARMVYGAGSRQAAIAQAQLNYQIAAMGGAGQIGVAAEMRLAQAAMQFNSVWDKVTQQARATFVDRLALPVLKMAQSYLPLMADAANRNFGIMGKAIQPLLLFLDTTGHKIFADLENVFAKDLPIGMGIFVQSLELILKMIDRIATTNNFGAFLQRILDFVTRLNTSGFEKFMGQVQHMITLFHEWSAFISALGKDIYYLFSQSLGLGESIIVSLTVMLQKLGQWMQSTAGRNAMHSLFEVHKQEILELLKIIPLLVRAVGPIYLAMSTLFTRIAIPIIVATARVVEFLTSLGGGIGTMNSFALALLILQLKTHLLSTTFGILRGALGFVVLVAGLSRAFLAMAAAEGIAAAANAFFSGGLLGVIGGVGRFVAGLTLATVWLGITTAAQWALNAAQAAFIPFAIILGILAVVAALIWFVTHLKEVGDWIRDVTARFGKWIDVLISVLGPIGNVVRAVFILIAHFNELVRAASKLPVIGFIFKGLADGMSKDAAKLAQNSKKSAVEFSQAWQDTVPAIQSSSKEAYDAFIALGDSMDLGIAYGILQNQAAIDRALRQAIDNATNAARQHITATSPSQYFANRIGLPIALGIAKGILDGAGHIANALKTVTTVPTIGFRPSLSFAGVGGLGRPSLAFAGAVGGSSSITLDSHPTINIIGAAGNPQQIARELQKALDKNNADILKALKSGAYAIPGQ